MITYKIFEELFAYEGDASERLAEQIELARIDRYKRLLKERFDAKFPNLDIQVESTNSAKDPKIVIETKDAEEKERLENLAFDCVFDQVDIDLFLEFKKTM